MQKVIAVIFFAAWLLCGCSVDQIFDDWRAALTFVIALAVTVLAAAVITIGDDN